MPSVSIHAFMGLEHGQVLDHFSVLPLLSLFVDVKVLNISELRNNISTFVQQKQVFRVFLNALDHHYQVTPFHGIAV